MNSVAGGDWLAVGDAAATMDPLSSQGILRALRGGIFASYAIEERIRGDAGALGRYAAFVASEHEADRAAAALHYSRESRWAEAPFWSRRRGLTRVTARAAAS
jgi:flavin-dependent dehydrogenase